MSESFVDLSFRGLSLAKRIKLTQVRAQTGYLELSTPMPVGTAVGIATDDGVLIEAVVTEIHEQVGGSPHTAGMMIRPNLSVDAQASWWRSRLEPDKTKEPPPPDADGKVTVVSPRMSGQTAVPELLDDGRDTGVMDAIDTEVADVDAPPSARDSARIEPRSGSRSMVRDTLVVPMGQPMEEATDVSAALEARATAPEAPSVPAAAVASGRRRSQPRIQAVTDTPRNIDAALVKAAEKSPVVGRAETIADSAPPVGPRVAANRADTVADIAMPDGDAVPEAPSEASRTMAMDAVDLAQLGLSQSSDSLPTASAAEYSDDFGGDTPPPGASDKVLGAKPSKRKRKKNR